jgi:hypothetical protein
MKMRNEKREKIVPVRFTDREYQRIDDLAREKGIPFSTFVRMCAICEVSNFNKETTKVPKSKTIILRKRRHEIGR